MESHADAVAHGAPVFPTADVSVELSVAVSPDASADASAGGSTQRISRDVPPGVPTAADLAAETTASTWDEDQPVDLLEAAELLRAEVASIRLQLEVPDVAEARVEQETLLGQLDDYLLPRLRRLDAPLLAVVGGSTGAGKSTLVNSIARREVTRSGVLRPTTRSPVLVHHPYDSGAFLSQRVLPGLARVTSEAPEPAQPIEIDAPRVTALRLVPHEGITPGLAVIDAPDIDSVVEANRELAVQMLSSADLWVFVTTSARYGDAVPWKLLKQAVDRGVAVAVVLDRVPPDVMQEVRMDLATRLRDRGLGTSPMFTIPETPLESGFLPESLVAPLAGWLKRLALDARSRDVVVRRTLIGVLDSLRERVAVVAAAADAQAVADADLRRVLESTFDQAREGLRDSLADGSVVRGELLSRWQEFVATGDVFRSLEPGGVTLRDRLRARLRPRVPPAQPVLDALHTAITNVVLARSRGALAALAGGWSASPAGAGLVTAAPALTALPPGYDARVDRAVRDWRTVLTDLLQQRTVEGSAAGALGLDGAVAVLGLLTLSGPDAGEPRGPGQVAATVLGALYGAESVAALAAAARTDLARRLEALVEDERIRVRNDLDALGVRAGRGEVLTARAALVDEGR